MKDPCRKPNLAMVGRRATMLETAQPTVARNWEDARNPLGEVDIQRVIKAVREVRQGDRGGQRHELRVVQKLL